MIDIWHIKYIAKPEFKDDNPNLREWDANIIAGSMNEAVNKLKSEFKGWSIEIIGEPEHTTMSEHEYENN